MKDGIFEIGDLVQHKTSKEKGIVVFSSQRCTIHKGNVFGCLSQNQKCAFEPTGGYYGISTGFGSPVKLEAFLLEPATPDVFPPSFDAEQFVIKTVLKCLNNSDIRHALRRE